MVVPATGNVDLGMFLVIQADNIQFINMIAGLDFDDNQGGVAGIFDAVQKVRRNKNRLVGVDIKGLTVPGHAGGSFDHHPMFRTVFMFL